jgi:hypothetical protein
MKMSEIQNAQGACAKGGFAPSTIPWLGAWVTTLWMCEKTGPDNGHDLLK